MSKRRVTIERTYDAPIEDVWRLWTTKDGIEAWWGPEGFSVKVRKLDLRPGGVLDYAMIATRAAEIEFMKQAGMPLSIESRIKYVEVVPPRLLVYEQLADFIPGVEAYWVRHDVAFSTVPSGVRLLLTFDVMHDNVWTERAMAGWESELGKLQRVLGS